MRTHSWNPKFKKGDLISIDSEQSVGRVISVIRFGADNRLMYNTLWLLHAQDKYQLTTSYFMEDALSSIRKPSMLAHINRLVHIFTNLEAASKI